MSISKFDVHSKRQSPGFKCYACGDRTKNPTFVARVKNRFNPPGDSRVLSSIENLFEDASTTIKQFYANHDGVLMYEDSKLKCWSGGKYRAVGIEFFPFRKWRQKSDEMREGLESMGWPKEEMQDWLLQGIAFGEIPHSANFFVIQPTGENAGKIFYADHDAFNPNPIAASFDEFLDSILEDPADFLNRLGCHTRFSDGETEIQWIPKEYVAE